MRLRSLIVISAILAGSLWQAIPAFAWHDMPVGYWAGSSVVYVARDHNWMADFGDWFYPDRKVTRRYLARAIVRAFAPDALPEPTRVFTDLKSADPFFSYANVAVGMNWIPAPGGSFRPDATVAKYELDRALVMALGLKPSMDALNHLSTDDGYVFAHPTGFAEMTIANELQLHFNHPSTSATEDKKEMLPTTPVPRSEMAYALHHAALAGQSWRVYSAKRFETITLPKMSLGRKQVITFALRYVGYPYIYAGEWYQPNASQAQGGFDCSGFDWWVMRKPSAGFDPRVVRPYYGWSLPERTSYDMAKAAPSRIKFDQMLPTDLMFFQGDLSRTDWPAIDHAGLYLGNGWMIHSSGSRDGVTLSYAGEGYWHDHFRWGRQLTA